MKVACGSREQQQEIPLSAEIIGLAAEQASTFRKGFPDWLLANRALWERFEREALKVWHRGRRHYSARTIIEVLRHETAMADTDPDFKINNNCAPDLARLFRLRHPQCADLFELRDQRTQGDSDE